MSKIKYDDFKVYGGEKKGLTTIKHYVTNHEDNWKNPPKDSLRYVVENDLTFNENTNNIIYLKINKSIDLSNNLVIKNGINLTLCGDDYICYLKNGTIVLNNCKNVVIRNIRSRPTDEVHLKKGKWKHEQWGNGKPNGSTVNPGPTDSMTIKNSRKILVHNCSFQWSIDEAISVIDSKKCYIMKNLVAEPLNNPKLHTDNVNHGYGSIISGERLEVGQNVYAFCEKRSPRLIGHLKNNAKLASYSNYIHSYGKFATQLVGHKSVPSPETQYMIINNYFSTNVKEVKEITLAVDKLPTTNRIFVKGNQRTEDKIDDRKIDDRKIDDRKIDDQWKYLVRTDNGKKVNEDDYRVDDKLFNTKGKIIDIEKVFDEVVDECGAFPVDFTDERIKNNIKNNLFYFVKSQDDV